MEYKQELLGTAFRKARATKAKIAELDITPGMPEERIDALIEKLAAAKALLLGDGTKVSSLIGGMEWYVERLVKQSSMTDQELLQQEYNSLNEDNSDFDELVGLLSA